MWNSLVNKDVMKDNFTNNNFCKIYLWRAVPTWISAWNEIRILKIIIFYIIEQEKLVWTRKCSNKHLKTDSIDNKNYKFIWYVLSNVPWIADRFKLHFYFTLSPLVSLDFWILKILTALYRSKPISLTNWFMMKGKP